MITIRGRSPSRTLKRPAVYAHGDAAHASQIEPVSSKVESTAELIDRETGVRELIDILENIIAEAGDLIESRSPELVAHARAAVRRYADESPRQAE